VYVLVLVGIISEDRQGMGYDIIGSKGSKLDSKLSSNFTALLEQPANDFSIEWLLQVKSEASFINILSSHMLNSFI